jgi:uncharacterized protein
MRETVRVSDQRDRFLDHVLRNANNRVILDRAPALGLPDWWLTAGAVFQTVWNVLDGREPTAGIDDYDLFYFDAHDLSSEAENVVIGRASELFADIGVVVEVCNEARVHLWYQEHFGAPAKAFESSRDAIDHFASTTCCYAVNRNPAGELDVYAPHDYDDLFSQRLWSTRLAPRHVYERKAARWTHEWNGHYRLLCDADERWTTAAWSIPTNCGRCTHRSWTVRARSRSRRTRSAPVTPG